MRPIDEASATGTMRSRPGGRSDAGSRRPEVRRRSGRPHGGIVDRRKAQRFRRQKELRAALPYRGGTGYAACISARRGLRVATVCAATVGSPIREFREDRGQDRRHDHVRRAFHLIGCCCRRRVFYIGTGVRSVAGQYHDQEDSQAGNKSDSRTEAAARFIQRYVRVPPHVQRPTDEAQDQISRPAALM